MILTKKCFCCSNIPFSKCCEPIITGERQAITAEALMRSRYSAYALIEPRYLMQTTHSSLLKGQNEADIRAWAEENSWQRLEVISCKKGQNNDTTGEVEFKAYFADYQGVKQVHHEVSAFVKEAGKWFYLSGVIDPKMTSQTQNRNDFCACGSGKKFKKCCGSEINT